MSPSSSRLGLVVQVLVGLKGILATRWDPWETGTGIRKYFYASTCKYSQVPVNTGTHKSTCEYLQVFDTNNSNYMQSVGVSHSVGA
jgi:hypothetical protein